MSLLDTTKFIDFGITPLVKKCKLDHLKTKFLLEIVQKFANVKRDAVNDVTFLTSDLDFCAALQKTHNQVGDDFFEEDDEFRRQEFLLIANQSRMFYTFRKILEIVLKDYPDVCRQPVEDQELKIDARIGRVVCLILVSGSDLLEIFGKRLSFEPGFMELLAEFVMKAKPGYFEDTLGLVGSLVLLLYEKFTD
jgi:hypothetical protein